MLNCSAKLEGGIGQSSLVNGKVSADTLGLVMYAIFFVFLSSLRSESAHDAVPTADCSRGKVGSDSSTTTKCATLPDRGQQIGERGGSLARRRYQKGRVFLRGKKNQVWVGRWREDEIKDGHIRRIERSEVLGSKSDFRQRGWRNESWKSVWRSSTILAIAPGLRRRLRVCISLGVGSAYATQTVHADQLRSHLRKHLVPFFGRKQMRDIGPEEVQRFVSSMKLSGKTEKNIFATFQMLWKSARNWSYVAHDAVSDVKLPKAAPRGA